MFGKKWDNHGIIMDFMEIYWGYPKMDGLFHGKSEHKMDDLD